MKNHQPPEKRVMIVSHAPADLQVHSIFYTIQGEGPFCGTPAVFVRLAGCNLQCPGCDTDYTSTRKTMGPYEILFEVNAHIRKDSHRRGLVVITGGEPFRQPQGLFELYGVLTSAGYYVQIETNGTFPAYRASAFFNYSRNIAARNGIYLVASPKTGSMHQSILEEACAFKYVMDHRHVDKEDGLPTLALDHTASPRLARPPERTTVPIYLQPRDEKEIFANGKNLRACVESCMKHGYILQLQIHKYIGME